MSDVLVKREQARKDIARNVRKAMRVSRVSCSQMAERLGCEHPNVSNIISGRRLPTALTIKRIALALGCTTDELLEGVGE